MAAVATFNASALPLAPPLGSIPARARVRRAAARTAAGGRPAAARMEPTVEELETAATSLLRDELRPYGRLLRKRLEELAGEGVEVVALNRLRALCMAAAPRLSVEQEGDAEWYLAVSGLDGSAVVDVYGDGEDFSESFWEEADAYVRSLATDQLGVAGGRYVCARHLMEQKPQFLDGLSLGKVCQFVQLAMTQRKLLGYCNGAIVPYARSESMVKEQCAEQRVLAREPTSEVVTSFEVLRGFLQEVLVSVASSAKLRPGLPLSNIKRLIRSRFEVELSETALGHRSLADLFKDERLSDVCVMKLLDNGYYLYPPGMASQVYNNSAVLQSGSSQSTLAASDASSRARDDSTDGCSADAAGATTPPAQVAMMQGIYLPMAAVTLTSTTPCVPSFLALGNAVAARFPAMECRQQDLVPSGVASVPAAPAAPAPVVGDASARVPPVAGDASERQPPPTVLRPHLQYWCPQVLPSACARVVPVRSAIAAAAGAAEKRAERMAAHCDASPFFPPTPSPWEPVAKFADRLRVELSDLASEQECASHETSTSPPSCGASDCESPTSQPGTSRVEVPVPLTPSPNWCRDEASFDFSRPVQRAEDLHEPALAPRSDDESDSEADDRSDASPSFYVRNTFIDVAEMSRETPAPLRRSHSLPRNLDCCRSA
eukprot:TRINITY_DN20623_c0_g1_i1.p1 TRINITY_DN20623_c0_g1~~TRINITY_DN20623_c0_g1_i1.p1  ORF type:complete len:660 (+),score=154.21 TRINITY_DN20623_c0_g1_i1:116-2095(+)